MSSLNLKQFVFLTISVFGALFIAFAIFSEDILLFTTKILSFKQNLDSRYLAKEINDLSFDTLGNITILGQSLFNYYSTAFLLAGLVLLVALVGAVALTLNFNTHKKNQVTFRQLSRTDAFLSHFKK